MPSKQYDLKRVICTIGGAAVSGYGEEDAIGLEWDEDIFERTVTADGQTVYSKNNNRGLMVTITVMQSSRAYLLLAAQMELQTGDTRGVPVPIFTPLPFFLVDPSNGDTIGGAAVFMTRPAPGKSKTVGEVQFQLHIGSPVIAYGLANLI
jgi:hypothetical protein